MSRSPAVTAAELAIVEGKSPDQCLERVVAGRPHDVSPKLWADVVNAFNCIAATIREDF